MSYRDPRDNEIDALKARVRELEAEIAKRDEAVRFVRERAAKFVKEKALQATVVLPIAIDRRTLKGIVALCMDEIVDAWFIIVNRHLRDIFRDLRGLHQCLSTLGERIKLAQRAIDTLLVEGETTTCLRTPPAEILDVVTSGKLLERARALGPKLKKED